MRVYHNGADFLYLGIDYNDRVLRVRVKGSWMVITVWRKTWRDEAASWCNTHIGWICRYYIPAAYMDYAERQ
jgi:hypothetical protein